MSAEPEDNLERLFAEEEAAIRDDGFSQRVMADTKAGFAWRKTAVYGAGIAGAGFAVGGIVEMSPNLKIAEWFTGVMSSVNGAVASTDLTQAAQALPDTTQIAIVAVIAGISFIVAAAMAVQSR